MRFTGALFLLLLALRSGLSAQPEFSQDSSLRVLRHLVLDIGPRPMGSPAERRALEYAVQSFKESGCDTSFIMPFDRTGRVNTSSGVAVGVRRGATGRVILVGGHIDTEGPEVPGADDDGSGAATVLELARAFGKSRTHSTLLFCCFGGEEQGLEGSKHFVAAYPGLDSVDLMLQADMANGLGTIDLDPDAYGASAPPWLVRAAVEEFGRLGYGGLRYPTHFFSLNYAFPSGAGSDHEPFLQRGIPAIDLSTDVGKPIHTPRDNFENFDQRGLKRTGDLFVRLIARFDGGVPGREVAHYWLYLLPNLPLFVPFWLVRSFAGLSLLVAVAALVSLRKRREVPGPAPRVRWSGVKLFLASLVIASSGWLSSDLIALLRGVRHPWLTAIPLYYLFAFFAVLIAGWFTVRLMVGLGLSRSPYHLFMRAAILLTIAIALAGLIGIRPIVEPAAALFLISLAALARRPALKLLLVVLAPWWVLRLLFSEWDALLLRTAAIEFPPGLLSWIFLYPGAILLLTVTIYPFVLALASVVRDSPPLGALAGRLNSRAGLVIPVLCACVLGASLCVIPVFDTYWCRDAHVDEIYDGTAMTREVSVRSSEYLKGISISHAGRDTSIGARTRRADLVPSAGFDTTWLTIGRLEQWQQSGDATMYDVKLRLTSKRRPLSVSISYTSGGEPLRAFDTPWQVRSDPQSTRIQWYSFPDSALVIPISFSTTGHRSVTERIEVTYDGLADPVGISGEMLYVIPRTTYVATMVYRK